MTRGEANLQTIRKDQITRGGHRSWTHSAIWMWSGTKTETNATGKAEEVREDESRSASCDGGSHTRVQSKSEASGTAVDSGFLWSKERSNVWKYVSIPCVMEASRTIASYRPLFNSPAVITLLWRVALSGAEIAKAHWMRALAATHNSACAEKSSVGYRWLISMICALSFPVEMDDAVWRQSRRIQRKRRGTLSWGSRSKGWQKAEPDWMCFMASSEKTWKKSWTVTRLFLCFSCFVDHLFPQPRFLLAAYATTGNIVLASAW